MKSESLDEAHVLPTQFLVWQGNYESLRPPRGTVIYQTNQCPDLVLEDTSGKNFMYRNPRFFSPTGTRSNAVSARKSTTIGPFCGPFANSTPYLLASRAAIALLQNAGRSLFDSEMLGDEPLAVHYWRTKDGALMLLLGNLERAVKDDSAYVKLLRLKLSHHFVSPQANTVCLRESDPGSARA